MAATFVALGNKGELTRLVTLTCDVDVVSLEPIPDREVIVLFRYSSPDAEHYKCYLIKSLQEWFGRGHYTLPDIRLRVAVADARRIIGHASSRHRSPSSSPPSSPGGGPPILPFRQPGSYGR